MEPREAGFWDRVRDGIGRRFLGLMWAARRAIDRSMTARRLVKRSRPARVRVGDIPAPR